MITESKLFPNLSRINKYSAKDVADLTFGYLLTLHMFRQEFEMAPWSIDYARKSMDATWKHTNLSKTDLYQFLNVLLHKSHTWTYYFKDQDASDLFLNELHLDVHVVQKFLHNIEQVNFDPENSGRLLLQLERDLKITTSNYKSMRRILSDWHMDHVTTEAKRLVITRLLHMMRAKAALGDITSRLQKFATQGDWEIPHTCDPETGEHCDSPSKPSLIKQLALGAGLGVGAYMLGKALFGVKK